VLAAGAGPGELARRRVGGRADRLNEPGRQTAPGGTTRSRAAWCAATLAALLGLCSAAISAYWALGGDELLDTVGGGLEKWGRRGGAGVVVALWLVVVLKTGVALAAPVLVAPPGRLPGWTGGRVPRTLGWVAGIILLAYGGILTAGGLLVESGLIPTGQDSDQRALAWHAYLWDPWFAVWGLALLTSLWLSARARLNAPMMSTPSIV